MIILVGYLMKEMIKINKNEKNMLDLGSGDRPHKYEGYNWYGIDIRLANGEDIVGIDLVKNSKSIVGYFGKESIDLVVAYDFLEHVPNLLNNQKGLRFPRIELLNSIWKVLKPGGIFESMTPVFDPEHLTTGWCRDCTHTGVPWCKESFYYFSDMGGEWDRLRNLYDIEARFHIEEMTPMYEFMHLLVKLRKP